MANPYDQFVNPQSNAASGPNPYDQFVTPSAQPQQTDVQKYDPTTGMSTLQKLEAGFDNGLMKVGRGVRQLIGEGAQSPYVPSDLKTVAGALDNVLPSVSRADVDEANQLSAPLENTGAGKLGTFAGVIAPSIPASMIPGANTALGSTLLGAVQGATQQVGTNDSRGLNTALGGALGLGGNLAVTKGLPAVAKMIKNKATQAAESEAQNAVRNATLAQSQQAGYVVPPSEVNPNVITNTLERWAGKASVAQKASLENQAITNKLAQEELGLPKNTPITTGVLEGLRKQAGQAYEAVKNTGTVHADPQFLDDVAGLNRDWSQAAQEFPSIAKNKGVDELISSLAGKKDFSATAGVELVKHLRQTATSNLKNFQSPESLALGAAQRKAADAIENLIDRNLVSQGRNDIVPAYRAARQLIAKTYTVEDALNDATGDVAARTLGKALDKGQPLSGKLKQAAQFAQAFPRYAQTGVNPVQGGSPLDAAAALASSVATHDPRWLGLLMGRPLARSLALSRLFQPSTAANVFPEALDALHPSGPMPGLMSQILPQILNKMPSAAAITTPGVYFANK